MRYADKIPYQFVLDHLPDDITIKPMFGCYGVYADGKLCLFMLRRDTPLMPRFMNAGDQNGIYLATTAAHVTSLRPEFPDAAFQMLKGDKVWIFFSERSPGFEGSSMRACELINSRDKRVGR